MTDDVLPMILENVLAKRVVPGRPVLIKLAGDPIAFRLEAAGAVDRSRITLKALSGRTGHFRSIGRVGRLLNQALDQSDLAGSIDESPRALLPFLAAFAADWASRLAEQMGTQPALVIRRDVFPLRLRTQYKNCLRDVQTARRLAGQISKALIESLRLCPGGRAPGEEARMLRLQSECGEIRVTWLDAEGNELGERTFFQMVRRVCASSLLARLGKQAEGLRASQQAHRAVGEAQLEAMCPELAKAVRYALKRNRRVGYWICSTKVRGLPVEVYLYLDAMMQGRRYPRASLVARRAHEEFVLENVESALFYFPPIQLVACIDFAAASPPWHVLRPYVRMPRANPIWRHPYTGNLDVDRFSRAELLGARRDEAMVPISREARRLLPVLAYKTSRTDARQRDLCMYGQDFEVSNLVGQTCGRGWHRGRIDLFGLVQGLWKIARVGLTRAHQNNGHMPRATLSHESMPYPLPSRGALTNSRLVERIFPFDPHSSS